MACKDCTSRHVGCHATCKEYIEEKRKRDERNEKIRTLKHQESEATGVVVESMRKRGKKK